MADSLYLSGITNLKKGKTMNKFVSIVAISSLSLLPACASIVSGSTQEVLINTTPTGADCALNRQGETIARVNPTPGGANIKKTKYDLNIVCNKKGYQETTYINKSGSEGSTFGNIILGGGIGWAVDSANGADNHYDSPINITLPKK